MKKFLIFGIIMLLWDIISYSQVSISVSEVYVYAKVKYIEGDFDSDEDDGPFLSLKLLFKNNSNDTLCLHPSKADIKFIFCYKGKSYKKNPQGVYNMIDQNVLILNPHEVKIFELNTNILMESDLINKDKTDFFNILFCILPTLQVSYKEFDIVASTIGIREVILTTY